MPPRYDLRSDTVTRPDEAMRQAMAQAEVGDDVYREDPTARALEARAAELTGKPAALFMPTGSMGNQVALSCWAQRHQGVLCERRAHLLLYEQGAMAALSGLHPLPLEGDDSGCMDPEEVERALRPGPYYRVPPGVVTLEITHNVAGGQLPSRDKLAAIQRAARGHQIPVHLDGARLFNAAAAWDTPAAEIAALADSVTFCLSKGLGAPVGSVLCGPAAFIERALPMRKRFGGGMRQVGILAAAGLHALEHNLGRLGEDHAHARTLAEGLAQLPGLALDPQAFPTNIVYIQTRREMASRWVDALAARGVLLGVMGPETLRFCTHLDIHAADLDPILAAFTQVADELEGA